MDITDCNWTHLWKVFRLYFGYYFEQNLDIVWKIYGLFLDI